MGVAMIVSLSHLIGEAGAIRSRDLTVASGSGGFKSG